MMEKKNLPQPTDTIERMAAKIDEIYDRLNFIETLMSDLGPGLGKVAKDLSPTIKDLRELYEKDETLELIMKVGDNIPTFLTLLNLMGTVKGMLEDLAPAIQKISKDTQPTIRDLREKFEKDETLELIMKVGDNIPTFLTLLNLMGTVKGMLEDLAPAIQKISKDTQPTIRDLREKFEKDETLELIMKVGDNIPTFLTLLNLMGTVKGMLEDLAPAIQKISKDTQPTIRDLREKFEKDETLELIMKVGDNIPTFLTLLNLMGTVKGMLEDLAPAIQKISKDTQPTIRDLREKFEKDETLELIMKVGDNIPTFLTLLNLMGTVKGMLEDLAPAIQKISKDTQPTIRDLREKFEKDETLELIMKVGDNIPTFLTLLNLMGTVKGMLEDLAPAIQKISKDTQPTIRDLREKFEKEETLELIMKAGDNLPIFIMLMDLLGKQEIHDFILKTIENIKIFRGLGDMLSVFDNLMNFLQELNKAKTN